VGYRPDDLAALDEWLARHDVAVDRVVCRVYAADPPWQVVQGVRGLLPLRRIGAVDLALDLPDTKAESHAAIVAELIFGAAALPGARVWLGPLLDLDRSMDEATGLLDRLSNPRPAFVAARTLNTLLFASPPADPYRAAEVSPGPVPGRVFALDGGRKRFWLVLPDNADASQFAALVLAHQPASTPSTAHRDGQRMVCYHLAEATSELVEAGAAAIAAALERAPGPTVLVAQSY
jgi:hypothetical protein